jgi:cell division inhibitor SepF
MDLWDRALVFLGLKEPEGDIADVSEEELYVEEEPRVKRVDRKSRPNLRSISTTPMRMHIVEPKSFNDAQQIGDKFKSGIPVIINLQQTEKDVAKRIVDFSSGLVYALNGAITTIAQRVFLITPRNVEIGPEEKKRLQERFFNQF